MQITDVKIQNQIITIENEQPFLKRYGKRIIFSILSAVLILISYENYSQKQISIQLEKTNKNLANQIKTINNVTTNPVIEKNVGKSFTEQNLVKYLNELNIKYVDIVLAQAKLESGNYSSPLFKSNNNLFGMRKAEQRPTTTVKVHRRYAYYDTWQQSVLDYALFQSTVLPKVKSKKEYIAYIGKNYAELPKGEYERLLKPFLSSSARE